MAASLASLRAIKAALIDLNGTLHVGDQPIPGSVQALSRLRQAGVRTRFVSNTTKTTSATLVKQVRDMGFEVKDGEVFTSIAAARSLVAARKLNPLLLLQPQALPEFEGLSCAEGVEAGGPFDSVVVGLANQVFTFDNMNLAFRILMENRSAPLIAIHKGRYVRLGDGSLSLGPGPYVTALEFATGKTCEIVGKPTASFFRLALDHMGADPWDAVMVGDDVFDDVSGAQRAGLRGVLVQTGKYREGDERKGKPDAVVPDFQGAVEFILEHNARVEAALAGPPPGALGDSPGAVLVGPGQQQQPYREGEACPQGGPYPDGAFAAAFQGVQIGQNGAVQPTAGPDASLNGAQQEGEGGPEMSEEERAAAEAAMREAEAQLHEAQMLYEQAMAAASAAAAAAAAVGLEPQGPLGMGVEADMGVEAGMGFRGQAHGGPAGASGEQQGQERMHSQQQQQQVVGVSGTGGPGAEEQAPLLSHHSDARGIAGVDMAAGPRGSAEEQDFAGADVIDDEIAEQDDYDKEQAEAALRYEQQQQMLARGEIPPEMGARSKFPAPAELRGSSGGTPVPATAAVAGAGAKEEA